jgi:iron complex outermembrane receptor protein
MPSVASLHGIASSLRKRAKLHTCARRPVPGHGGSPKAFAGAALMQTLALVRLACGAVLATVMFVTPAAAQDPYRQTVVVTAATTPVDLGSTDRAITVLTREEIATLPVSSVADVLRLLSSVDVRARGVRGVQTDFSVRGASFGQALILVDGQRLNDAQSGHHNGDVPVPLDAVERIEVLYGPGSSLFGADAFGGTINIITRRDPGAPRIEGYGGTFATGGAAASAGFTQGRVQQTLDASFDRSGGFIDDRDYETTLFHSHTALGSATGVSLDLLNKRFGANNFYGGNAPSREWTNEVLAAVDHHVAIGTAWSMNVDGSYRTHGDRFIFNELTPALSDNHHRTHEVTGRAILSRHVGRASLAVGGEAGGDWVRSTNLGDHDVARAAAFAEWRQPVAGRSQITGSLRVDHYSEFGTAWNPSLGFSSWVTPRVHLRASVGHAFRVPTFTERYYSDPANLARPDVQPEHSWAGDGGVDVMLGDGIVVQATLFRRADRDVIDWLRATTADVWRTYNIRDVDTDGVELSARKTFSRGAFLLVQFTDLTVDAPSVTLLSKYALDYAPRSFTAGGALPLPGAFRVSPRVEYRLRQRPTEQEEYVLLDLRVARRLTPLIDLSVDGLNLLDRSYSEIAGVPMPGATMLVSVAVGK